MCPLYILLRFKFTADAVTKALDLFHPARHYGTLLPPIITVDS